jgi:hypothetical protein
MAPSMMLRRGLLEPRQVRSQGWQLSCGPTSLTCGQPVRSPRSAPCHLRCADSAPVVSLNANACTPHP